MPDYQGYINTGYANYNAVSHLTFGTLTCTLNALANNVQQSSGPAVSMVYHPTNSPSGEYMGPLDFGVIAKVKTGGTVSGSKVVNVYIAGSNDQGVTWSDGVFLMGTDSAITLTSPKNVRLLGSINTPATGTVYQGGPWSVGQIFGGVPPSAWCLIVENKTGGALDATAGGTLSYYISVGTFF